MIDVFAKVVLFTLLGIALLAADVWYLRAAYQSIKGGSLVIAPIRIIGGPAGTSGMDEVIARMLLVRIRSVLADLEQSQSSLQQPSKDGGPSEDTPTIFPTPRTVQLNAQLFEPAKIDVKVAGVEVGGLLPWIQSWFVGNRTLTFTISIQDKATLVAGNVDALGDNQGRPIWVRIDDTKPESIAEGIAYALLQRAWAAEAQEIGELNEGEFRTLVQSVGKVAEINRRVRALHLPARAQYADVLQDVGPLAERITSWNELTYFAAIIAEGAGKTQQALLLYNRLKDSTKLPISAKMLAEKQKYLTAAGTGKDIASLEAYREQAEYATEVFSRLFGFTLPPPTIELLAPDYRNVYWDGEKINIPPGLEDLPDLVAHEAAYPFIQKVWKGFRYDGQTGAMVASYADVLASIVRQRQLHQTAQDADWTISPGAVAWLTGQTREGKRDLRPLRSLKAPGTAYVDETVGKDLQIANYSKVAAGAADDHDVHIISGIPNKAFYETAMKIGTEKASRIWVESLKHLDRNTNLPKAAQVISNVTKQLYGDESAEAKTVQAAWNSVGL